MTLSHRSEQHFTLRLIDWSSIFRSWLIIGPNKYRAVEEMRFPLQKKTLLKGLSSQGRIVRECAHDSETRKNYERNIIMLPREGKVREFDWEKERTDERSAVKDKDRARPFLAQFSKSFGLRSIKFREEFKYGIHASIRTTFHSSTEAPYLYQGTIFVW